MNDQMMSRLIEEQPAGYALNQAFYSDPDIFERELERIFFKSWLYVGHVSQIPAVGDYFLYEIAGESVIVVRSDAERVGALLNVCRHRGSRICLEASGNEKLLVCRYHGWTYQLDGKLRGASYTDQDFDKRRFGLRTIQTRVFHGLIFINFAEAPVSFEPIARDLDAALQPYGLARAKVAHKCSYPIEANWKLAVENYCECYHCAPAHPEFTQRHARAYPDEQVADLLEQVMNRADQCGLSKHCLRKSWLASGGVGVDRGFERYALFEGFVTGSEDGRPVAPLLGDITDYDGGATDVHIGPFTFLLAYCDHVVVYRFTPSSVDKADCEISWLVKDTAKEGIDYDLERLIWLWDVTTIADKGIIEHNQEGVNSRFYEPGPYSSMEDFARRFIEWYLWVMSDSGSGGSA